MRFIKNYKKWLLSSADRQVLCPEQHIVNHPKHGADNSREHFGWKTRDIKYCYRFIVANPGFNKSVEVALDLTAKIGFVAAPGRKKEREPTIL